MLEQGERLDHVLRDLRQARSSWTDEVWVAAANAVTDVVRWRRLLEVVAGSASPGRLLDAWRGGALEGAPSDLPFAVRQSIPDWLDAVGRTELGAAKWESTVAALNRPALLYVRANTLKCTRDQLATRLAASGVTARAVDLAPEALVLEIRGSVYRTSEHREGLMEIQDAASQAVCHRLDARPGMRVIDGCAGAGGKTLHLAALMANRGRLVALDVDGAKLETLRLRSRRAGVAIVEARHVDTTKVIKRRHASADRLLLDVPCSGLGVLRRNPEARWRLDPAALDRLRAAQARILARYAPLVKPGGRMAYVTCSVLPSEGEAQVRAFVAGGGWVLVSEERLGPPAQDTDCFYVAVLEKEVP